MYTSLHPGDPAPWFKQRSLSNPSFNFDSAAGRFILLGFFGSAADPVAARALAAVQAQSPLFDDTRLCFFGISTDPEDESQSRIRERIPGFRYFLDFDGRVSRLYGALPSEGQGAARQMWILLDPSLRVIGVATMKEDGREIPVLLDRLTRLPQPAFASGVEMQAPVLMLPNVFDRAFCDTLIEHYNRQGGTESGFMREENGKTVPRQDASFKRRKDCTIDDETLRSRARALILRRVVPEIAKAHQFHVTRMERYIVACYDSADSGHFRAHRDNTTKGTAHRRFAVSINLNDAFEGGEVSFPEFNPRSYKPPVGGAVVFSCSILHAVSRVTSGARYAFLPFLYDDAAAELRARNLEFLAREPDATA